MFSSFSRFLGPGDLSLAAYASLVATQGEPVVLEDPGEDGRKPITDSNRKRGAKLEAAA